MDIPIAGPWITEHEIALVAQAAEGAWYENAGTYNSTFESAFAKYVGRDFAISLPSCTAALHLALAAMGICAGDEVIVPESTWIATAAPITYVGAVPVFVDVDPQTWCIDVSAFEAAITDRTRAVIPVDLYGGMPNYDSLIRIAESNGVKVIEDAAEAIGSSWRARLAGAFGDASVFSFHGSKTLTTGEGGMLVTDDAELKARVDVLRDHGRKPGSVDFLNDEVAFKYKMSSLQAALGKAQLDRIDELVERKRTIFGWYADRIGDCDLLTMNPEPAGLRNSFWMVTVVFDSSLEIDKTTAEKFLGHSGIATRPFFHPLSSIPAFAGLPDAATASERNPVSYRLGKYGLNLPSALRLTEEDIDRVCSQLLELLDAAG